MEPVLLRPRSQSHPAPAASSRRRRSAAARLKMRRRRSARTTRLKVPRSVPSAPRRTWGLEGIWRSLASSGGISRRGEEEERGNLKIQKHQSEYWRTGEARSEADVAETQNPKERRGEENGKISTGRRGAEWRTLELEGRRRSEEREEGVGIAE